jgi:hypothetical protein
MAALPPLQYHITRMGPDPEREKLNRILEDARKRFSTLDGDITFLKAQIVALTGVNGVVTSVNGQQGDVTISIASLGGVPITRTISSGQGLAGGGNLSADRTLSAKISTDPGNTITFGTDDGLFSAGGGGGGGSTGKVAFTFTNAPFEAEATISAPITVNYDWEITGWRLFGGAGESGSATVDWLLLNTPDDIGTSITASLTPTVNGTYNESTTLTGWTTTGTDGQLLQAVLTNVSGFKTVVCELFTTRV